MNNPGKYVLLNRVHTKSQNIKKRITSKNQQLKDNIKNMSKKSKKKVILTSKNLIESNANPVKNLPKLNKSKQKLNLSVDKRLNVHTNKNGIRPKIESKKDFGYDLADRLKASRFRFINEQLYTHTGEEAEDIFRQDDSAFSAYHDGYRKQVKQWPLNPLDRIINSIKKLPSHYIAADFGCGEGRLAKSVPQKCYSFDLVAANDSVIACNMAHTPLSDDSVNVAVFCLSLMGTNLKDFLLEANRVLKIGGHLKIAEIESRFDNVNAFIKNISSFGFQLFSKDISTKVFYFLYFKKIRNAKELKNLPTFRLRPCLYKKR